MNTRRQFLITVPLAVLAGSACRDQANPVSAVPSSTPGAPPAFGTAAGVGPEVSATTFAEAEKLAQTAMTPADRNMAAASWRRTLAPLLERRVGPRKVALEPTWAPATLWNPVLPGVDVPLVPSLRDEMLTISNFTGHPSLTLRAGFVEVAEARSDWAPDPNKPLPKFAPPRRVPHGITFIGRLFDEGLLGRVGLALERALAVAEERPSGF